MWIWNTNIYFWQQWPVYLRDRNDHGLIGCSRELCTLLPGLLQTTGRHTAAPTARLLPTDLPHSTANTFPCRHSTHTHSPEGDTAGTACPSPTQQSQTSPGRCQKVSLQPHSLHLCPRPPAPQPGWAPGVGNPPLLLLWVLNPSCPELLGTRHKSQITQSSLELRSAPALRLQGCCCLGWGAPEPAPG